MRLSIQFSYDENGMTYLFPSPLGEMGLSILTSNGYTIDFDGVSVPSRGNGVIDSIDNEKSAC